MATGQVGIARDSEKDIKMRDLYVLIDDQEERNLTFGGSLSVELEPGNHRIKVTNRMYSEELQFTLQSAETVSFQAANVIKSGALNALAMSVGQFVYRPTIKRI